MAETSGKRGRFEARSRNPNGHGSPPSIVGIGASVGGLPALQDLVTHIPGDSGIAWVLIQHMAPDRPSELAAILARRSELAVEEITEDTPVEADRIYVISPGRVMTIRDGVLRITADDDPLSRRTSIDAFLISLAEDQGEQAGCALLSGAGTDGTLGLKAVKEAGGLTLTQTLQNAEYDSMLSSATRTGLVDKEADVADLPALFAERAVEMEFQTTMERLQSTMEELETSSEELSSVNEELQSSNEELETSREELQSINEELRTVNNALSTRVEELSHANSDLKNLFSNTRIAMLFLDRELRIRNFTPPAKPLFHLRDHDMGRPLHELAGRIDFQTLKAEVEEVMKTRRQVEHQIRTSNGGGEQTFIMRALPYRGENDSIQGAVLTFVDITDRKRAEEKLSAMVSELNHRVKNNLASVQSMVRQGARRAATKEELTEFLSGRLRAMSSAHSLLSNGEWQSASLADLAASVLSPYAGPDSSRLDMHGPDVDLRADTVVSLGLILQELATNATKYGAWSGGSGQATLSWKRIGQDGRELRLEWRESGGPPARPPERHGFGLEFLTRSAEHELQASCEHSFPPEGYRYLLVAPASLLLKEQGSTSCAQC